MAIPPKDTEHCSYSLKPQKKRPASPNTADLDSDSKEGVTSAKKLKNRSTSETRARKRKRKHRKASVVSIMGLDRASESTSAMNIKSIKGKEKALCSEAQMTTIITDNITADVESTSYELKSLRDKIERQEKIVDAYKEFMTSILPSLTCPICLDPMSRPYSISPCGHTLCYNCLVAWFRSPPPYIPMPPPENLAQNFDRDNPELLALGMPMLLQKDKTCPHCRTIVHNAPVEAWYLKDILRSLFSNKGGLSQEAFPDYEQGKPPDEEAESSDPWQGIFKPTRVQPRSQSTIYPDHPVHDISESGFFDEDDNVYRCVRCLHEIWDGVCSSCGRHYLTFADTMDANDTNEDPDYGGDAYSVEERDEELEDDWLDQVDDWIDRARSMHGHDDGDDDLSDSHYDRPTRHSDDEYESSFIDDEEGAVGNEGHLSGDEEEYNHPNESNESDTQMENASRIANSSAHSGHHVYNSRSIRRQHSSVGDRYSEGSNSDYDYDSESDGQQLFAGPPASSSRNSRFTANRRVYSDTDDRDEDENSSQMSDIPIRRSRIRSIAAAESDLEEGHDSDDDGLPVPVQSRMRNIPRHIIDSDTEENEESGSDSYDTARLRLDEFGDDGLF